MNSLINILIAGEDMDEAAFLDLAISEHLRSYEVFCVKDGNECLQCLEDDFAPELIFLDLDMPSTSGLECLKTLREMRGFENTPVVMYATSHNHRDIAKAYKLGADCYIIKPVTLTSMTSLLGQLFNRLGERKKDRAKEQFVLMNQELVAA